MSAIVKFNQRNDSPKLDWAVINLLNKKHLIEKRNKDRKVILIAEVIKLKRLPQIALTNQIHHCL